MELKLSEKEEDLILQKLVNDDSFVKKLARELKSISNTEVSWMNKKQACEYLGVSNNTLTNWIKDLDFPVSHVQGRYFFTPSNMDMWLKKHNKK